MYRVTTYFFSKTVVDLPVMALSLVVFSTIVYLMLGLANTWAQFGRFQFVLIAVAFNGQALGLLGRFFLCLFIHSSSCVFDVHHENGGYYGSSGDCTLYIVYVLCHAPRFYYVFQPRG